MHCLAYGQLGSKWWYCHSKRQKWQSRVEKGWCIFRGTYYRGNSRQLTWQENFRISFLYKQRLIQSLDWLKGSSIEKNTCCWLNNSIRLGFSTFSLSWSNYSDQKYLFFSGPSRSDESWGTFSAKGYLAWWVYWKKCSRRHRIWGGHVWGRLGNETTLSRNKGQFNEPFKYRKYEVSLGPLIAWFEAFIRVQPTFCWRSILQ